jgi:putative hydrolase of the HAD superfamily
LPIKAVSFDFWNTLFTEPPGGFAFYRNHRRALLAEAVSIHRAVGHEEFERACHLEAERHNSVWQHEHRTLPAAERVEAILSQLNISVSEIELARLAERFEDGILEHPPVLVGGARQALEQLSPRYRLAIISDVGFSPGRVLRRVLDANGLLEIFDSLVFSDEAGRAKPHVEVFEATARSLEFDPNEIVHVGDLERTDIAGAKRAGYRAIRFTGVTPMANDEATSADFVTNDLREVPRLVEML